jgi:hypothetical protein
MKLSIFTTVTNPLLRGDDFVSAFACYYDLADEITVVHGNGNHTLSEGKWNDVSHAWPREFNWPFIGQQFQRGYEACTGDWVIHADIDFLFHERDFDAIRKACEDSPDAPALSFWKYQFVQPDRYNIKSRLVIAVNKGKYGDRIRFDSGGDLCQPSLDGKHIATDDVPEAGIPFYNYEKLIKSEEQIKDDVGRMDRAYQRHYGKYVYGEDGTDESAYEGWLKMALGRYNKAQKEIQLSDHPKYIQETIKNLTPEMWGHSAFGRLEKNNYA